MSCLILQNYKIIRPDKAGAIAICVQGERRSQVYLDYAELQQQICNYADRESARHRPKTLI